MLLRLLGQPDGRASSMNALRPANLVGTRLREELPAYLPWFKVWREQRNAIKAGYCSHLKGPTADLGVAFTVPGEAGAEQHIVSAPGRGGLRRFPAATVGESEQRKTPPERGFWLTQ